MTNSTIPNASNEPAQRQARLTVDLAAVRANWRFYARLGQAEAGAVVKANGYGLGAAAIAQALAAEGARTFFVSALGEALSLRAALGPGPLIHVLEGTGYDLDAFAAADLRPVLSTPDQIRAWGDRGPAALHVDTGMNRLGLPLSDVAAAREALASVPLLMSHLACAGEAGHPLNARQLAAFGAVAPTFPEARLSLAASSGALLGPDYHFDLLRPGIGLYGDDGSDGPGTRLATVATLEAPILQLRDVTAGESVGYGATFVAQRTFRAATIALGYADGYLRQASNRGYGALGSYKLPIVGRVSMDLITLDVSAALDRASVGARVEMLGPNVPLRDVAAAAQTISYEVLTSLSAVSRSYTGGPA